ncbi:MAG: hypothetical protein OXC95_14130 [Dehalococcoidia bacterium]|nr:hypothetical protein [Dehalococcoidia bacterium]
MFKFFLKQVKKISVIAVVLVFGSYCGGDGGETKTSQAVFEGLITSVEARTLLDLESIEVTDDEGKTLEFHAAGRRFMDFTPSHVREHMLQGLGVIVTYRKSEDGALHIVDIRDRPP